MSKLGGTVFGTAGCLTYFKVAKDGDSLLTVVERTAHATHKTKPARLVPGGFRRSQT